MSSSATAGRSRRFGAAAAAALFLVGVGVAGGERAVVAAAAVPLAFVAYGALDGAPAVASSGLAAERTVSPATAPPGRLVRVRLTLRNEGSRTLHDVRVVDGAPEGLAVNEGTPRGVARLRPGEEQVISYAVTARRGEHEFDAPRARLRGRAGVATATGSVATTGDRALSCRLDAGAPPLGDRTARRAGAKTGDEAGPGVEFHSVREYRPGDPASRVDWRHYAKRGELATVDYRERRARSVVIVVDARAPTHVVAARGRPTAAELCAYGAVRALDDLLGAGDDVGVAVLGRTDDEGSVPYLAPGGGAEHRALAVARCRAASEPPDEDANPPDHDRQVREVARRAPPDAQFLLFSPLFDDPPVEAVAAWRARDRSVGVLAPDVLAGNTVSGQQARTLRSIRLAAVGSTGARAVDWPRGTPLSLVLDRAVAAERTAGRRA
ncbi:MAG: DUF58 domain-containing protein [Haloferacaceae archaeon]